jgi:uncharacterized protein (TIGR03032 family)
MTTHFSQDVAVRHDVLGCDASEGFCRWMSQSGGSLAVTTYQAGKIVMIGWNGRQITILPRDFDRPMGLASEGSRLLLATRNDVTILADAKALAYEFNEHEHGRYDALFLPRVTYHTADLSIHDVAFGNDGPWVVATRFSCLATIANDFSFVPRWHPSFISEVAPGDRCHLNGLAMEDGRPKYVTALGQTDEAGGWRACRLDGGVVIDVPSKEIVAQGLCMPHSPRVHRGRLWVLNSGAGELISIDLATGRSEVVIALPGYLRGLAFTGQYALVGMGTIRQEYLFGGLPVSERHSKLICGVAVVDLETGKVSGLFEFTSGCTELYDVQHISNVRRPMILSLANEPTRQAISTPEFAYWLRPSSLKDESSFVCPETT